MDKRFLNCKIRKYMCPYCGHWHKDVINNRLDGLFPPLSCPDVPYTSNRGTPQYTFSFSGTDFVYTIKSICENVDTLVGKIPIEKFRAVSARGDYYVAHVIILNLHKMPEEACSECKFSKNCVYRRVAEQACYTQIAIKVAFAFSKEDFERISPQK